MKRIFRLLWERVALETAEWGALGAVLVIGALIAYRALGGAIVTTIGRLIGFFS
jgi:hypothetical protein